MSALQRYRQTARPQLQIVKSVESHNVLGAEFSAQQVKALEKAGFDILGKAKALEPKPRGIGQMYATGYKNNPASSTLTATTLQGPFQGNTSQWGLFSQPGVRPERFSALSRPFSIAKMIIDGGAMTRSEYANDILEIVTGQTDSAGSNASSFCGDPPIAGQLKVMARLFTFGQFYMKTKLESAAQIGRLVNRADVPGRILNEGPHANPLIPDIMYQISDTRSQLQYELYTLGVEIERQLEQVTILGNASLASGSTHRGWIKEFAGLDGQITTGITDAINSQPAPAVDSVTTNWANALVSNTQASTGRNINQAIRDIYWSVTQRAAQVGMQDFDMAIVMREELFLALTDVYACGYALARCSNGVVGSPQIVDQNVVNNLRLEMLNGQYLLIEGVRVPVVFTTGLALNPVGGNQYVGTMYFVPVSWAGRPLLRFEYFPMDNQYTQEHSNFVNGDRYRVINNGLYLVGYRSTGMCDEYHFQAQVRLILETPFLAGRIDNLNYTFLAQPYSPYPSETALYRDGGSTYRVPYYSGSNIGS